MNPAGGNQIEVEKGGFSILLNLIDDTKRAHEKKFEQRMHFSLIKLIIQSINMETIFLNHYFLAVKVEIQ